MSSDSNQNPIAFDRLGRRQFIGVTAATAGALFIKPELVRGTQANSAVRVGLLGCGGRGTEDATNLFDTGNARVVALADLFRDQLDAAHVNFDKLQQAKGYAAIDASQLFVGPNAYQQIAASKEVDATVIATPPYYHPHHVEAVVAAGKHVYLEKPVAVDVPGALRVIEIGKRADGKLSFDVGFQIRECPPFVELVRRIHAGALGKIVSGEAYYLTGYIDRPAWPSATPLERRLRNWVHDRTLSGDIIVEQNIHVIDICNWILQSHRSKFPPPVDARAAPPTMATPMEITTRSSTIPTTSTSPSAPLNLLKVGGTSANVSLAPRASRNRRTAVHSEFGETNRGNTPPRRKTLPIPKHFPQPENSLPISN
jgi:predicted dehydrogenase